MPAIMLEEVAYALAGVYSSDTFRFNTATHYLNLDKGRHFFNALTGYVPGVCIGYIAEQITGKSGLMELCSSLAVLFNILTEFPVKPSLTPAEIDAMYAKLRQDSKRKD